MAKITKAGMNMTSCRGKITATKMASTPQPQLSASNARTQSLMSKGSFCDKLKPGPTRRGG